MAALEQTIGAPVIKSQQSSLTSGTSDCTNMAALFGSRPRASMSSAMSNVQPRSLSRSRTVVKRVQVGDKVKRLVVVLEGNVLAMAPK